MILSVSDSTKTVLFNPDAVVFDSDRDAAVYMDGDTISYVQEATKHRFLLREDTLSYIGYENRATDFRLTSPVVVTNFQFQDGSEKPNVWNGRVLHYGSMILCHTIGTSTTAIEKGWKLTDGTDTIHHATRLVWTLDMAYADRDSIDKEMPDSVASERISEMQVDAKSLMQERLLTERTLWFTRDARYPVLTDSRISRILFNNARLKGDTVPVSGLAMYYPSSHQYEDTGEEITDRKPVQTVGGYAIDPYNDKSQDNGITISVGEPKVSGNFLEVTLSSQAGPFVATVTLFSESGIRLTEPAAVTVGIVPQSHPVEIPSGWSGVMLLRIDAGEESYTEKIIR